MLAPIFLYSLGETLVRWYAGTQVRRYFCKIEYHNFAKSVTIDLLYIIYIL